MTFEAKLASFKNSQIIQDGPKIEKNTYKAKNSSTNNN